MKVELIAKYSILLLLAVILTVNVFGFFQSDQLYTLKTKSSYISQADSYFSRLNLWYYFASNHDWATAAKLESKLSANDLLNFKRQYEPVYLQRRAQTISQKNEQSVEDLMELGKIYANLNQKQNAIDALVTARRLDPLRVDLENLEIEIKK